MYRRAIRVPLAFVALLLPAAAFLSCSAGRTALKAPGTLSPEPASPGLEKNVTVARALGRMPLYFIENRGQLDSRVAYYIQGRDTTLYFTADGMTLAKTERRNEKDDSKYKLENASLRGGVAETPDPGSRWVVKLDFVGANPNPKIEAADPTPAVISYFNGPKENWKAGLPTYGSIVYSDLWPGIDLVYSGTVNRLKYTFLVKPGADPAQVKLAYRGARGVRVNDAGQLEVETPAGVLQDDKPYAYQDVDGRRVEIGADYSLDRASADGPREYGFALGSYDRSKPLVLDPAVFVYCGYIGGGGTDVGFGIAVDGSGNAYVTGATNGGQAFPVTVGPDLTFNGLGAVPEDAFVAKVKADGTGLVYCGYIGGSGNDEGHGIAVDSSGNAYVTGQTSSTEATFPVTVGPDLSYNGGLSDAFVAKVNAAGTALLYCGYIGGGVNGPEAGNGIAVDGSGNAYVTGMTPSNQATFPVKVGPDVTYNPGLGPTNAFVAKVAADGSALVYCGYIGASSSGHGIAVDSSGNAYVTGTTSANQATFPVTVGPDLTFNGFEDAFVAKVNAAGTALVYCGYIGGSGNDEGNGIAVDSSGNAYVTGFTQSTAATFPVTVGPDLTLNGGSDAFVAKVNAAGTALVYCGYIGGFGNDQGNGIAVDSLGNAYVTGQTSSSEATFPVIGGPDLTFGNAIDAFVAKVAADGTALLYCGYIGGSGFDEGHGIAVDSSGNAYVVGQTSSTQATFPVTVGPDVTFNGGSDAFVAKIGVTACAPPPAPSASSNSPICPGDTLVLTASTIAGATYAWTGPNGFTSALQNPSIVGATAANAGIYSVTATVAACTSTAGSTNVEVNPTPVITTLAEAGAGSPNRAASVASHAGSTYLWTIGNGTITSGQGTSQIAFTAGTDTTTALTLSVTETNVSGCVSAPGNATVTVLSADSGLQFYTVTPCRVLDTRAFGGFTGAYGPPSIAGGTQRDFVLAGQCGLPAGARAVSINAAVWAPTSRGDLRVFPAGVAAPVASTLNWETGILALANAAVVPLNGAGAITVLVDGPGTVDIFFDVNGYFQ